MKTNLYVIFDSKAGIYNTPFKFVNDQVAMRAAADIRRDTSTEMYKHPDDFTLFGLGTYDDTTALIEPYGSLKVVCRFNQIPLYEDTPPEMETTPTNYTAPELKEA